MAFSVTPKLLRLVSSRGKRPSLSDAAKPHMQELRDLTRETIQLGVMSGREGVIIDQVEGLEPLRIVVDIGLRFLLHCNAPGKMLLAHMPISQRKKVIEVEAAEKSSGHDMMTRRFSKLKSCSSGGQYMQKGLFRKFPSMELRFL